MSVQENYLQAFVTENGVKYGPRQATRRSAFLRAGVVAVLAIYAGLALFRLGWADLGSDEGWFGVLAENIASDSRQLALVSATPLGKEGGDKPYIYPLTLAGSIALFGRTGFALRIVSGAALLVSGLLMFATVQSVAGSGILAALTLAFFLLNPWTITYARVAQPEPLVMCAGCFALFAAEKWRRRPLLRWAVLCGVGLGLGFLAKLWLIFPFIGGCAVAFATGHFQPPNGRAYRDLAIASLAFVLVAGSHLILVFMLAPESFNYWVSRYFIFSLKSRAAGAGYDPVMWFRPWWFYPATAFKATFFGLPLLLVGLNVLVRKRLLPVIAVVLILLSPIAVFSLANVKQASYIYPTLVPIAFLISIGFVAIWDRGYRNALLWAAPASALIAAFFFSKGLFGMNDFVVIEALNGGYLLAGVLAGRVKAAALTPVLAAAGCGMLVADFVSIGNTLQLQHHTHYREIADFLQRRMGGINPRELAFIAPEAHVMEFYTYHTGEYWGTFYEHQSLSSLTKGLQRGMPRFYIVDRAGELYGSHMLPGIYSLLLSRARDITPEIERAEGQHLAMQIFESEPCCGDLSGK